MNSLKRKIERLIYIINGQDKEFAELKFWRRQIDLYVKWYRHELPDLYGHPAPAEERKIRMFDENISAILTFFETHQKPKYQQDLQLPSDAFTGMNVLDVGSGPFPNALCFEDCEVYSLDPLMGSYINAGYPMHCYDKRARFVCSQAENIPFGDQFFDVVISVNAIDHVNDFAQTARELKRVLKKDGKFRMHVHYHPKTKAEPIELTDEIFKQHYSWVTGLYKVSESKVKTGTTLNNEQEKYVVWGNQ